MHILVEVSIVFINLYFLLRSKDSKNIKLIFQKTVLILFLKNEKLKEKKTNVFMVMKTKKFYLY